MVQHWSKSYCDNNNNNNNNDNNDNSDDHNNNNNDNSGRLGGSTPKPRRRVAGLKKPRVETNTFRKRDVEA